MIRRVDILPAAEDDLDAGRRFYERQAPGLGSYFLDSLISDVESLLVHGGVHRKVHGLHRSVSKRFPYAIFYRVEGDTVFVHAVLDCRRDPDGLRRRLSGL